MAAKTIRVGLIGYGYWGQKLARVLNDLGVLAGIADPRDAARDMAFETFHVAGIAPVPPHVYADYQVMLGNLETDAVAIATPPETHYKLAREALEQGLHAFVEKPLATRTTEARELEGLAREKGLRLKVGHIYLHCPGLASIPRPLIRRELYVSLLNRGGHPAGVDRDLKWAGLPHAASIACHFFPDEPVEIKAFKTENSLWAWLHYWDRSQAWLTVADHTGLRARMVDLVVNGRHHQFNADRPHCYEQVGGPGLAIFTHQDAKEPLMAEIQDFLENDGEPYPLGSTVVGLTKRIVEACQR